MVTKERAIKTFDPDTIHGHEEDGGEERRGEERRGVERS